MCFNLLVVIDVVVIVIGVVVIVIVIGVVVANHPFKIPLCWWRREEDVWVIYLHLLRYNLIEKIQRNISNI